MYPHWGVYNIHPCQAKIGTKTVLTSYICSTDCASICFSSFPYFLSSMSNEGLSLKWKQHKTFKHKTLSGHRNSKAILLPQISTGWLQDKSSKNKVYYNDIKEWYIFFMWNICDLFMESQSFHRTEFLKYGSVLWIISVLNPIKGKTRKNISIIVQHAGRNCNTITMAYETF